MPKGWIELNQHIKEILKKDLQRNMSIIGFIENYPRSKVYQNGNSWLVLGRSDHLWAYISSADRSELIDLLAQAKEQTKYFASLEDWMKEIIVNEYGLDWELTTDRFIFPATTKIEQPVRQVNPLKKSAAHYIYQNSDYQQFTSIAYINQRIATGLSAGIIEEDKLVAWGLTHDDNALGFLHVLPEYRGLGYAHDISRYLIQAKRKNNQPVFVNVEPTNLKSKSLSQKIGFVFDRKISWLKIR